MLQPLVYPSIKNGFYLNCKVWVAYFGPPRLLQCDNGSELKEVVKAFAETPNIKLVNGNPRHPQSQGLVEQT